MIQYYGNSIHSADHWLAVERKRLGVARLPAGAGKTINKAWEKHCLRMASKAPTERATTPAMRLARRRQRACYEILAPLMARHYRQATSSWAGGENTLAVDPERSFGPEVRSHSYRVWSANGKWSGTNLDLAIAINYRAFLAIPDALRVVGGMVTLSAQLSEPGIYRATWVVQGRGLSIATKSGFIVDGEHHAPSIKAALKWRLARRVQVALDVEAGAAAKLSAEELIAQFGSAKLTMAVSRRAGNCVSGTESRGNIHFPGRDAVTIAEALAVDHENPFVLRAARYVAARG